MGVGVDVDVGIDSGCGAEQGCLERGRKARLGRPAEACEVKKVKMAGTLLPGVGDGGAGGADAHVIAWLCLGRIGLLVCQSRTIPSMDRRESCGRRKRRVGWEETKLSLLEARRWKGLEI